MENHIDSMRKTSLPTALVYGWDRFGEITLKSDVYHEENLHESVIVYSYDCACNFKSDFAKHKPDVIMLIGPGNAQVYQFSNHTFVMSKIFTYSEIPPDNVLANDIVCQSTFWACRSQKEVFGNRETPIFSIFTPTYKTNERIFRTYESLKNQTYPNWEWVVVDDSPEGDYKTWEYLKTIAEEDYRVKPYRMSPNSGGNVGEVKHRAAMLCNGEWLVELDHDDTLITTCLQEVLHASWQHEDAGFIYTDVTEVYENGAPRQYGYIGDDWYGHPENKFDWGYAGHTWQTIDGVEWLVHHYPDINPKSIRFNIGMPNHCRIWRRDTYSEIRGHSRDISVADDFELIVKTFLHTRIIHLKKMLYVQYNNGNSTVDNNSTDINRRARLIKDYYDPFIHQRILELGKTDWCWDESAGHSWKLQDDMDYTKFGEAEQVLNYIVE